MISNLIHLFFPRLCVVCSRSLISGEEFLCTHCEVNLPVTHFHREPGNPVEKLFWGRVNLERAYAYLYYRKEGAAQHILHELKYKGNKELAAYMGRRYGQELVQASFKPDAILAVPLHKAKQRKRGYNQSAWFAKGLSEAMEVADLSHAVGKKRATSTQTRKSRFERWRNTSEVFVVHNPALLEHKHLLICDDVITTGATLEALASVIPPTCRLSVCSIAVPVL